MRTEPIGHATVGVTIENQGDLWDLDLGQIERDALRSIHLPAAIVDPKAVFLSLPTSLYRQLGLSRSWPARITILGRTCTLEIQEAPDSSQPTIGHVVLTCLDLVIDPKLRTLVGNPAHGGEWILESYFQSSKLAFPTAQLAPSLSEPIA